MKNREFLEFLTGNETPPATLKQVVAKDISLSFHKKSIILRFLAFQLLGAAFSMTICPQFGMGLVEGHGITHSFRMIGDWACAAFCGVFFLSSGLLVAFLGMKGEELWWVWRRYKHSLIFLPAFFWGVLMMFNVSLSLPSEAPSYHLIWIAVAMLVQVFLLQFRGQLYFVNLPGSNKPS